MVVDCVLDPGIGARGGLWWVNEFISLLTPAPNRARPVPGEAGTSDDLDDWSPNRDLWMIWLMYESVSRSSVSGWAVEEYTWLRADPVSSSSRQWTVDP
jgi:hypothetical protein